MKIEWFESFDQYAPLTTSVVGLDALMTRGAWSSVGRFMYLSRDFKRTGRASLGLISVAGGARRAMLDDHEYVVHGSAFYMTRLPIPPGNAQRGATVIQQLRNEDDRSHVSIQVGPTGRIYVLGGGLDRTSSTEGAGKPPELTKSRLQVAAGTWNYMETKVRIHPTAGSVEVRVNGVPFCQYSGKTSWGPGSATVAQIALGHFDPSIAFEFDQLYWDDIYIASGADADFRGDVEVHYLRPVEDQEPQEWDLTKGNDAFALLNEIPPDGDADYIFTADTGDMSRFRVEALPVTVTSVAAVAPLAYSRKTDSGPAQITLGVVGGVEEAATDAHALTTGYQYFYDVWEADPDGDSPWTPGTIPLIQIERTA